VDRKADSPDSTDPPAAGIAISLRIAAAIVNTVIIISGDPGLTLGRDAAGEPSPAVRRRPSGVTHRRSTFGAVHPY
jgi:hypothetical protein